MSIASVVIAACNEEHTIRRCLGELLRDARAGEFEVIVVCNGCTDRTADLARKAAPDAIVIELDVASKAAALNAGDEAAHCFPRVYLDADVEIPASAVRALVETLKTVPCTAPVPSFDLQGCALPVRWFYRIWSMLPYLNGEMVGSGVYALSADGRQRFAAFPVLTADDQFVMQQFDVRERRTTRGHYFTIHPPRSIRSLIRIRTRVYRGSRELARSGLARHDAPSGSGRAALRLAARPGLTLAVAVYLGVNLVAKTKALRASTGWERDDSTRQRKSDIPQPGAGLPSGSSVAYITSRYPSTSHSFIRNEVLALRALGVSVETFSVRRSEPTAVIGEADRAEAARTSTILPIGVVDLLTTHLRAMLSAPNAYFKTLRFALSVSPGGGRRCLWQVFYFAEAIILWSRCRSLGIRHIHAHFANVGSDLAWLAAHFGSLATPRQPWKWTFTMHGPTELFDVTRFNLRRKVAAADVVVCISDFCRSQLMAHCHQADWNKLIVAHCGVDITTFSPASPLAAGEPIRVVCVGRLVAEKAQQLLLEAIADLKRKGLTLTLTIAGDGPEGAALRERARALGIEGSVDFLGALDHSEVPSLLRRHDVACLPSFAEGVPVVLMEAMASGLPVVSTMIAGVPELVTDGVEGFLVPPGRVDALVEALEALAVSPKRRLDMGMAGRSRVVACFEATTCARQVAKLLAAGPPNPRCDQTPMARVGSTRVLDSARPDRSSSVRDPIER